MLIAEGTVKVRENGREAALAALREMIPQTLAEPGCNAYRFGWDIDDEDVIHIHEEWADEAALADHLASDHMARFNRALGQALAGRPDMRVHEVAGTRPLFDN